MSDLENKCAGTHSILQQTQSASYFTLTGPVYTDALIIPDGSWQGDLTTVEETSVWIPIAPSTEPKQPTSGQKSHADSLWPFLKGTHKPEPHKHTKVHDVRANSCSLTYGLGWGQQLEARCLLRMSRAVSLGLYFSDTQYRASQPTLADCSHTVRTQKAIYSKHKINPSTGCSQTVCLHVYPMLVIHKGTILSEPSHGNTEGWYDYVFRESKRRELWPPSIYQRESSKTVKAYLSWMIIFVLQFKG